MRFGDERVALCSLRDVVALQARFQLYSDGIETGHLYGSHRLPDRPRARNQCPAG
jgi:hypothetical protein